MAISKKPPVITIMGHVDHGKTSLLDYLRHSHLAAREHGGITQHIGAYQITYKNQALTFIDTPGHAAFGKMRERGAAITDMVVLVVAANDGVKPQTIESIRHIKNAAVPVVVALNKIDLPDINVLQVKSQLAEQEIVTTDFGGDVEVVEISAKTGKGVDKLLDTLLITAELLELQADSAAPLQAVVIEAARDPARGCLASVIVQQGTLSLKQNIYTSSASGKVRSIIAATGASLKQLLPGDPGQIMGWKALPQVGEIISAQAPAAVAQSAPDQSVTLNLDIFTSKPKLRLLLKADTQGTLEAIVQNFDSESIDLIYADIGEVSDSDVEMAKTAAAKILAFQVKVPGRIQQLAKSQQVTIKSYKIIYELIEYLQKKMLKLLEPTIDEVVTGEAKIAQIFQMKGLHIAGVKVQSGEINKNDKLHLLRGEEIIADPVITSMMHGKQEISRLKTGDEGGLVFKQKHLDFQEGDVLRAYRVED